MINRHFTTHMYLLVAITYLVLAIAHYWLTEERETKIAEESREEDRGRVYQERENTKKGGKNSFCDNE